MRHLISALFAALLWVLPQLVGQVFLRLYLLTEHTGCAETPNGLINTRTTLTNAAMRRLMWNMSYHAEHHLYPSIPFHRLPAAHGPVRDRLGVMQDGYARWHAGYLRAMLRDPRGVQPPAVLDDGAAFRGCRSSCPR